MDRPGRGDSVAVRTVAPQLGERTAVVLSALGYSAPEVEMVRRERIV
jgi:crotonobetainyl-CoA:carnitine CoA-transferase CaiB-like acyl-CoA transferase